jgi:hypothetical protein
MSYYIDVYIMYVKNKDEKKYGVSKPMRTSKSISKMVSKSP